MSQYIHILVPTWGRRLLRALRRCRSQLGTGSQLGTEHCQTAHLFCALDLLDLERFEVVHKMASSDTIRIPEANVAPNTGSGAIKDIYREKMKRSVVYIDTHDKNIGEGSGSLVEVMEYMPKPLLLTCHHVIPSKEIAKQSTISFDRLSSSEPGVEVKGSELFNFESLFVTHKDLDFTLIAVYSDKLPGEPRCSFSFTKSNALKLPLEPLTNVTLIHYPYSEERHLQQERVENSYRILYMNDKLLMHSAETHGGSSGCPVLREVDCEWAIVAMHCSMVRHKKTNEPGNQALCIKAIKDYVFDKKDDKAPDYDDAIKEAHKTLATIQSIEKVQNPSSPDKQNLDSSKEKSDDFLKRMPSDAGLQYVTKHQDIGRKWPDLALALGVPEAYINRNANGVTELIYWRNGKVDDAKTTWEYLLQTVKEMFGVEVEASLRSKIASKPLLTKK